MNKIYFDIKSKKQFINDVKYDNEINYNITLIKKYHKYGPFIDFFPTVLKNIIWEYIDDIILLKCYKYKCWDKRLYRSFNIFGTVDINSIPIRFQISLHFINIQDKFDIDEIYIDDYNKIILKLLMMFKLQIFTQRLGGRYLGKMKLNTPDFSNSKFTKPNYPNI